MMKKLLLLVNVLFLFSSVFAYSPITVNISVKNSFGAGEKVFFDYELVSYEDSNLIFIPFAECPKAHINPLKIEEIKLEAGAPFKGSFNAFVVDEIESQKCKANIIVIKPFSLKSSKEFSIITNPSPKISIEICTDDECKENTKVFTREDNFFVRVSSDADQKHVSQRIFEDETAKEIPESETGKGISAKKTTALNKHAFVENKIYSVEASVDDPSFKKKMVSTQFVFIPRHAKIKNASACNANLVCEAQSGENSQNCPLDCKPVSKTIISKKTKVVGKTVKSISGANK